MSSSSPRKRREGGLGEVVDEADVLGGAEVVRHVELQHGHHVDAVGRVLGGDLVRAHEPHLLGRVGHERHRALREEVLRHGDPDDLGEDGDAGRVVIGAGSR